MKRIVLTLALAATIGAAHVPAQQPKAGKQDAQAAKAKASGSVSGKEAFAKLKQLVGTWEESKPEGSFQVIYKLTGGGSALIETQFPGSGMEMTSVYHMDGENLMMTHYCAAGNQPTLIYVPGKSATELKFDFHKGSNMKPTDMHIHGAVIKLLASDHIKSDWIGFMNGKDAGTTTFDLKRKG